MKYYSSSKHACYLDKLNYSDLPDDLIEITEEEHKVFMGVGIDDGYQLVKNKYPFEFEKKLNDEQEALANDQIIAIRSDLYANALNGSDRLFVEYQALLAQGNPAADDKKAEWLARRDEIKLQFPLNQTTTESTEDEL